MPAGLGRAVLELKTDSAQFFRDLDKTDSKFEALKGRIRGVSSDVGGASGNLDKFGRGLAGVSGSADGFNSKLGSMVGGVRGLAAAFGVTVGAGALVAFGKSILSTADNIQDMSQKMGVSAEAAQRFTFAAKQGGADIENVTKSIVEMNRNLAAPEKSTVAAFKAAGLSIEELRKKKPEEAFRDIIAALEKMPNEAMQTDAAFKMLGKSGVELLPAIRSGFLELADGAHIMSEETVQRLADANQAWENFFNDVTIYSAEFLSSVMKNLGTAMSGFSKFLGDVKATTAGFFSGGFGGASMAHAAYMEEVKKSNTAEAEAEKTSKRLKEAKEHLARSAKFAASATGELTDAQKKAAAAAEAHRKAVADLADEMSGRKLKQDVDKLNESIAKMTAEEKKNPEVVARMMKQIKPLVDAGGLPLLSAEAHEVYLKHSKLHELLPKVNADLGAILDIGPKISMQYVEWKDTLAGYLAIQKMVAEFSGKMSKNPLDILGSVGGGLKSIGNAPSLMATMFTSLKGKAIDFGKSLGPTILAAVTGGGDVWRSIGASGGMMIGQSMAENFGGVLKGKSGLGKFLGEAITSFLPGVGALLGPLLGKLGAAFKTLGRNVARDMQDAFATTELGFENLGALSQHLKDMGPKGAQLAAALDRAQKRDDEGATKRAIEDVRRFLKDAEADAQKLKEALDGAFGRLATAAEQFGGKAPAALQPFIAELLKAKGLTEEHRRLLEGFAGAPSWQTMQSMAEGLGVKLSSLGKGFQQAKLDDTAMQYARAFVTFNDAGADMGAVLTDAQEKMQELVTNADSAGLSIPAALRPWLQQMVDAGQLVDATGNKLESLDRFTFTGDVNDTFKEMKDILGEIRDLLAKGLPQAADEGAQGIRDKFRGGFEFPIRGRVEMPDMPGLDVPHLAAGGVVTRPTLAVVGEGGPEVYAPFEEWKKSLADARAAGAASGPPSIVIQYSPTIQAWDGADVRRVMQSKEVAEGLARAIALNTHSLGSAIERAAAGG